MLKAREELMDALGKSEDDFKPKPLPKGRGMTVEKTAPDKAADLMIAATDPWHTLESAAQACGLDTNVAQAVVQRLRHRYTPVNAKLREVQTKHLIALIEDRALMALEYMDEAAFAQANLRDLTIAMGVLLEKRQLLSGEPTQILSVEERRDLNEVLPLVMREAKRRGVTIDSHAKPMEPRAIAPRTGARHFSKTERKMGDKARKQQEIRERSKDADV
jgi:hypothetical protein